MSPNSTLTDRFFQHVIFEPNSGCWIWIGALNGPGYGSFYIGGPGYKKVMAHRWSWELENGPIDDELEIDHLCRVRCCVNPKHLEPVRHQVNILRGETLFAKKWRQTECRNGHPLSGDNLYLRNDGRRDCKTCRRFHSNKSYLKRREASA